MSSKLHHTEAVDELSPRRISSRRIAVSFSLPMSLLNVVDQIGESEVIAQAQLMERLIRKGLQVERDEREAKLKAVV